MPTFRLIRGPAGLVGSASLIAARWRAALQDSVAALSSLNQDSHPQLHALVFGEAVVNDATSIVLLRAVQVGGPPPAFCAGTQPQQQTFAFAAVSQCEVFMQQRRRAMSCALLRCSTSAASRS